MRWHPLPFPKEDKNFIEGLVTMAGAGEPSIKQGICIYL
jgi:homogentisate 1,2-dioxygenase